MSDLYVIYSKYSEPDKCYCREADDKNFETLLKVVFGKQTYM